MNATLRIAGIALFMMTAKSALAQPAPASPAKPSPSAADQELITLSKDKWRWMAERNLDALDKLFADEAGSRSPD